MADDLQTVIGQVITRDGLARSTSLVQPPIRRVGAGFAYEWPPPELRTRVFRIDAQHMRRTQAPWIGVDLDHDHDLTVGHVEHLELAVNGSLWMAAVIHTQLPDGDLYLSPESTQLRDDDSDLVLDGVAVCRDPAQICMEPITICDGPLAQHRDWRLPNRHATLAERAHATAQRRGYGSPIIVHGIDPPPDRHSSDIEAPTGPLWIRPGGPILSVR
jgi:hypothetical protein